MNTDGQTLVVHEIVFDEDGPYVVLRSDAWAIGKKVRIGDTLEIKPNSTFGVEVQRAIS